MHRRNFLGLLGLGLIGCNEDMQFTQNGILSSVTNPASYTSFKHYSSEYMIANAQYTDLEFVVGQNKTIAMWIRPDNMGQKNMNPIAYTSGTAEQYKFLIIEQNNANGNKLRFQIVGNSGGTIFSYIQTQNPLLRNRDYFVVVTYSGGTTASSFEMYINGVKESSPTRNNTGTIVSIYTAADQRLNLGRTNNTATKNYYSGYMSHLMYFNAALSDAEVTSLYGSGEPYNYATNAKYLTNGVAYIPLTGAMADITDTYLFTNTGTTTTTDPINVSSERFAFRAVNVGVNTVYQAFVGSYKSGSDVITYYREGTNHLLSGNIWKLTTVPASFSATGGTTKLKVIDDATYDLRGGSAGVIDGKVMVFSALYDGVPPNPGLDVFIDLVRYESTDGTTGEAFGAAIPMTVTEARYNWYGEVVEGFTAGHAFVPQYEHDGGGTWTVSVHKWDTSSWSKITVFTGSNLGESSLINLGSNTLMLLSRYNAGPYGLYQIVSTDGGATWGTPEITNLATVAGDEANCSMCLDDNGLLDVVIMDRAQRFLYVSKGNNVTDILADPMTYNERFAIFRSYETDPRFILGYPSIINLGGNKRFISTSAEESGVATLFVGVGNIG